jgi:hypothetical protein
MRRYVAALVVLLPWVACASPRPPDAHAPSPPAASGSSDPAPSAPPPDAGAEGGSVTSSGVRFEDDLAFLRAHGDVTVLSASTGGRVALSADYQGRVMTSAVGPGGASLGWVHRAFIAKGETGTAFDNYGGEDRFWLGPEAGPFGLYFPPGAAFTIDTWQTPHQMQEGAWAVTSSTASSVTFRREMTVESYAKTKLSLAVDRTVRLLDAAAIRAALGVDVPASVSWVAFESDNKVTNTGAKPWTKATGLPSIWILAMYAPSVDGRAILPFVGDGKPTDASDVVNDRYFGVVPKDRLRIDHDRRVVVFTCDGKLRSKIGLLPKRAREVLGSYSASARLLTIVHYDKPAGVTDYVNSMWEKQREPYAGDVVNSYNDGPVAPGKPPLGGFYELETSSPALALAKGASARHVHRTFHFVGDRDALDLIAKKVLGVSLAEL